MKKVTVMVCFVFWMVDVHADLPSFPICEDISPQLAPAVDGNLAAWTDDRGGTNNADIYARTLPGGEERAICTASNNQQNPAVSGSLIVWQDNRNGNSDIYMYDLSAQTETTICTDTNVQQNPDISGPIIVWQDNRNGNNDIYGYNLDTMTEFVICNNTADQQCPAISGDYVVWMDDRNGSYNIYVRDLKQPMGSEYAVNPFAADQSSPDISGNIIVWQDSRNSATTNTDIYGYDIGGSGEFPVCVHEEKQNQPVVAGDWIIWRDQRNKTTTGYDIYGYDIKTGTIESICTLAGIQDTPAVSQQYVVWQDTTLTNIYGAAFPVVAAVTVLSPNGGETWIAGSQHTILWQSSGAISTVKIEIFADNGVNWQLIADGVANVGTYDAVIPVNIHSQQCLLRISDTANPATSDQCDAVFTVFQCSLTADITGDCFVGLDDFAAFAAQWLTCGNPFDPAWCANN